MHDLTSPASLAAPASSPSIARGRRGLTMRWQALTATQRRLLLFAALTAASGLFHVGVWLASGMPSLVGPVTWRKPIVFGLSIAVLTVSLAWVVGLLPETRSLTRTSRAYIALLTMELALIDLQQWRGVGSHFNASTVLDTAIFAAMGLIIVSAAVITTIWTWHLFRAQPPAVRGALARGAVPVSATIGASASTARRAAGASRAARPSHDSRALAWRRSVAEDDASHTIHDTHRHGSAPLPADAIVAARTPADAGADTVIGAETETWTGIATATLTSTDIGTGIGTSIRTGTETGTVIGAGRNADAQADTAFAVNPPADEAASRPAHLLAARAAMLSLLAGNLLGIVLARWGSAIVARTGAPPLDGPFADVKLAHAVALHGLQVLPLLVFAAARLFANEARTLRITQIGVASYAGLLLFSIARAAVATELAAAIAALALVLIDGLLTRDVLHAQRGPFSQPRNLFDAMSTSSTVRS